MVLVDLAPLIPDAILDLRYASEDNVIGHPLEGALTIAQLDETAAQALARAAERFRVRELRLVIWDAYRPPAVQTQLKAAHPDRNYVLEESNHCRGLAVDVTLADANGVLLDMGTDHDDFSVRAHPGADGLSSAQTHNRKLLIDGMQQAGFTVWPYEWWHFDYAPAPALAV